MLRPEGPNASTSLGDAGDGAAAALAAYLRAVHSGKWGRDGVGLGHRDRPLRVN